MGNISTQLSLDELTITHTQLEMGLNPTAIAMGLNRSASAVGSHRGAGLLRRSAQFMALRHQRAHQ